ncbi:MAG: tetratricopeptide repeat protein [Bacteroidales bacterium]
MKKIVLISFIILAAASYGFSQNSKVVSAFNYHNNGKLDKAKENIDAATVNEKTMGSAKTWYYRGNIYIDIYRSEDEAYKNLDPDPLNKAYEAYKKAMELDTKNQYKIDILQRMPIVGEAFFNYGAKLYNDGMTAFNAADTIQAQKEFDGSVKAFENAYTIYSETGRIDTTTIYYISIAAELAKDLDKTKESIRTLIGWDYPEPAIYVTMANVFYKHEKNIDSAIYYYSEGRKKFPEDLNLVLNETNLYLAEGMTQKALDNLVLASSIDKTNPTIFFAIGAKYNEVVDDTTKTQEMRNSAFDEAVIAYDKAIELKPDYFDPNYNMGALYVNKAASVIDQANQLPLDAQDKYDRLKAQADQYLTTCLPYLEKAHELLPDDVSTLVSLKEIYTRLKMDEKRKEVDAKLQK